MSIERYIVVFVGDYPTWDYEPEIEGSGNDSAPQVEVESIDPSSTEHASL